MFQDNILHGHMNGIMLLSFQDKVDTNFQAAKIFIIRCKFYNLLLQRHCTGECNLAAVKFYFDQQNYPAEI